MGKWCHLRENVAPAHTEQPNLILKYAERWRSLSGLPSYAALCCSDSRTKKRERNERVQPVCVFSLQRGAHLERKCWCLWQNCWKWRVAFIGVPWFWYDKLNMKRIVIVRISISWVLPELFLTIDFSVFIYITSCFGMRLFPVTQHSTRSSMMDICWGRMGRGCGSGCGWGDGQKTDKHQRSISVQLQLTSSCVRLPHNYPLLPPGFIWSETPVSDVWIDRANSHACPNGITISPMRGCMYIQKKKRKRWSVLPSVRNDQIIRPENAAECEIIMTAKQKKQRRNKSQWLSNGNMA